jgi:hypothetical protein
MPYWTQTEERNGTQITTVQALFDDVFMDIGTIEKPYRNEEFYFVIGWNHETLSCDGSWIFRDFEAAKQAIIRHFECKWEVLNG